jgi:hypothetical protein
LTPYCGPKVQKLTQTLMCIKDNTFYVLFPEHKICLFFTGLNHEDTNIFRDGELSCKPVYNLDFLAFCQTT